MGNCGSLPGLGIMVTMVHFHGCGKWPVEREVVKSCDMRCRYSSGACFNRIVST